MSTETIDRDLDLDDFDLENPPNWLRLVPLDLFDYDKNIQEEIYWTMELHVKSRRTLVSKIFHRIFRSKKLTKSVPEIPQEKHGGIYCVIYTTREGAELHGGATKDSDSCAVTMKKHAAKISLLRALEYAQKRNLDGVLLHDENDQRVKAWFT